MVLAAGIVGFILGVNLGFLFAGLMRAAKESMSRRKMKMGQVEVE